MDKKTESIYGWYVPTANESMVTVVWPKQSFWDRFTDAIEKPFDSAFFSMMFAYAVLTGAFVTAFIVVFK